MFHKGVYKITFWEASSELKSSHADDSLLTPLQVAAIAYFIYHKERNLLDLARTATDVVHNPLKALSPDSGVTSDSPQKEREIQSLFILMTMSWILGLSCNQCCL